MLSSVFAFALLAGGASGDTALTLQTVQHRLAEIGPTATVRELDGGGRWEQVLDHIGSGDPRWIALARPLASGTDASTAETLSAALAEALPKSPRAVLNALNLKGPVSITPGSVCNAPFFEGATIDIPAYKASTLRILGTVSDARLTRRRDACVSRLQDL